MIHTMLPSDYQRFLQLQGRITATYKVLEFCINISYNLRTLKTKETIHVLG